MRRTKSDILYDIIAVLIKNNGKMKPTRLLYKANLSYTQMQEYIKQLIEKNIVEEEEDKKGKKFYKITEKGYVYFNELKKVKDMENALGL